MASANWYIDYNGGTPVFNPEPSAAELHPNDTITVHTQNFPSAATITSVTVYQNSVKNGENTKDTSATPLGTWTSAGGDPPSFSDLISISANSGATQVTITDLYDPPSPPPNSPPPPTRIYWAAVAGDPGSWSVDPEFRLKPGSIGG